jgi:hypothetical protein
VAQLKNLSQDLDIKKKTSSQAAVNILTHIKLSFVVEIYEGVSKSFRTGRLKRELPLGAIL